ncbi:hypothetical protein RGI82_002178 [Morganella morganii]|nr:hypothetical protein [Morganella morganii]
MNLFFKYKQDAVMNINRCCREPEQDFPEGYVNQQVTDFLSGMTKKKKENKHVSAIPGINSLFCPYNDKCYYGDILNSGVMMKGHNNNHRKVHDIMLVCPEKNKIKNSMFRNNVITEPPGDIIHNTLSADKPKNVPAEEEDYSGADISAEEKIPAGSATIELPEIPFFLNHPPPGIKTEVKNQPLRHCEQGRGTREKIPLMVYHTEKNALSPAYSRADYYCSYHFRQKYQPPEPVHIYRDNPGIFKLETDSESLRRRLKSAVNINGIDNIDII